MVVRFLPQMAALSIVLPNPWSEAGPESAIALEPAPAGAPFHAGDQLRLNPEEARESDAKLITVVQTTCWPWVLVRYDRSPEPYEVWINFAQLRSVHRLVQVPSNRR